MEFIQLLLASSLLLTGARAAAAAAAAAANNLVLDNDGNELRRGQLYYAFSATINPGGLDFARPANAEGCPLNVVKASLYEHKAGCPLAFYPEHSDDHTVREGSTLNIMFPVPTLCVQSTVWTLDNETSCLVTTGGTYSSAVDPHYSRFAIRKAEDAASSLSSNEHHYQIQACPCSSVWQSPSCRMGCLGSLGLSEYEGAQEKVQLKINNERPHTVKFVRVELEGMAASM